MTGELKVVLVDFGWSAFVEFAFGRKYQFVEDPLPGGTLVFSAPETFAELARVSYASDMWSIAMTLLVFCGAVSYEVRSSEAARQQAVRQ